MIAFRLVKFGQNPGRQTTSTGRCTSRNNEKRELHHDVVRLINIT